MHAPAALVAVPFLAGCVAGVIGADVLSLPLAHLAAGGALLCTLAAAAAAGDDAPAACAAVALGAALAGSSLGLTSARGAVRPPLLEWFEARTDAERAEPVVIEAVLREDATPTDYGAALWADVTGVLLPGTVEPGACCRGGVRLSVTGTAIADHIEGWRGGRRIRVPALLRLPTDYRNPGLPDARRGLALRGTVLVGSVKSASLVEVVAPGDAVREAAGRARAWTRRVLARHVGPLSARSAAIATAILINDRSGLDPDDEHRLQEAGTYHVIAISGGNIAVLTALFLSLGRVLRLGPRAGAAGTIVLLVFYGHLTGAPASVSRAVTAAVIYLAGRMLDQQGPPVNALAVAAVGAVAWWPLTVVDAGFLLSFGATLGILLGTMGLVALAAPQPGAGARRAPRSRRIARQAWVAAVALLAATVCAELALAPASAALFSRVTLAGLVVNFAAVPLMTVTQLGALATLGCAALHPGSAGAAAAITHWAAWGLVESARLVDVAPWVTHEVARPAWTLVGVYYAACLWLLLGPRRPVAALAVGLAYGALIAAPLAWGRDARPPWPGTLRLAVLDVGQGDASLVTLPDGRALLVDAGGLPGTSFDIGRRVVAPALRAFGVRRLDELVITHGDADHIGGALALTRSFRPRVVREGTPVPRSEELAALAARAASVGAAWRIVQAGDVDRVAGVEIRTWHPPPPDWERQRVRNDDSIVLEFRYGDVSFVLPGDIGREPELALARVLDLAPLVVLKAPHHGSAGSSTPAFVAAVRPAAVIVSAGRTNRFGHPASVVLARYRAAGAEIFRTDEDGAVIVETDGKEVRITTWSGRESILRRR